MSKSQNNNIFVWIGLCILLILPGIARTQSVELSLFAGDEKTIVFVSREMAPPAFVSGRRLNLVLEVLGFSWEGRNKVRLSIGRDTENQATIRAVKKRGRWHVYGGGIS